MKIAIQQLILICLFLFLALPIEALERVRYIHTDMLGSPAAATDEGGEVVWREGYRPYGERMLDMTDENRLWYSGKLEQPDFGLSYFGARWYDPVVGRFTGIDPVGVVAENIHSFSRYSYANNNPYKYKDPDGEYADLVLEAASITIGLNSLINNIKNDNYGGALLDAGGLIVDGVAAFVPGVPGVSGMTIKASRESAELVVKNVDIKVIGRLEDTKAARDWEGHDVLNISDWTIKKNDEWVQQGIKNKQEFYTASPERGNLWDAAANRETVYGRELRQIKETGYVKRGNSYIHPDNL
jgi:RHS repeat-associated protein